MKKLLSLLGSLGLVATASMGVVACGDNSLPGDGGNDNGGGTDVTPDPSTGEVTTSFEATFKTEPTPDTLKTLFEVKGADGNPVDATYTFEKESPAKSAIQLDDADGADSGKDNNAGTGDNNGTDTSVKGKVTVTFKGVVEGSSDSKIKFTIDVNPDHKDDVSDFTPVTVDVPQPNPAGKYDQNLTLTYDDIAKADGADFATLQKDPTWKNSDAEKEARQNMGVALNKLVMSKLSEAQKKVFDEKLGLNDKSDLSKEMAFWIYDSNDAIGKEAAGLSAEGQGVLYNATEKKYDPVVTGCLDAWWLQKDGTMIIPSELKPGQVQNHEPGSKTGNKYEFVITSSKGEQFGENQWYVIDLHVTINA